MRQCSGFTRCSWSWMTPAPRYRCATMQSSSIDDYNHEDLQRCVTVYSSMT